MAEHDLVGGVCPICSRPGISSQPIRDVDFKAILVHEVNCQGCGKFEFDVGHFSESMKLSEDERVILCGIIRHYNDEVGKTYPLEALNQYKTNIKSTSPPVDVIESIDLFLTYIGKAAPYFGRYTRSVSEHVWKARLFMPKSESFATFSKVVENEGYVYLRQSEYTLSLKGWQRLREIKTHRAFSKQAFVAMWFNHGLNSVFTEGIYPALVESGYKPFRVDRHPNENRIDFEIMAQIRASRILIADVTGERTGVYYEAGFAQGLGIPVIWTCNSSWRTKLIESIHPNSLDEPRISEVSWKDRLHFDTRQFGHIFWEDTADLKKQLAINIAGRGLNLQ